MQKEHIIKMANQIGDFFKSLIIISRLNFLILIIFFNLLSWLIAIDADTSKGLKLKP